MSRMEMKKVDLVLEKTKGIRKLNQDICQTSLTMAGALKKLEASTLAQNGSKDNCKIYFSFRKPRDLNTVSDFS